MKRNARIILQLCCWVRNYNIDVTLLLICICWEKYREKIESHFRMYLLDF